MILLIIWLTGSIASYFIGRAIWIKSFEGWNISDRIRTILFSVALSWVFSITMVVAYLFSDVDWNKPAK